MMLASVGAAALVTPSPRLARRHDYNRIGSADRAPTAGVAGQHALGIAHLEAGLQGAEVAEHIEEAVLVDVLWGTTRGEARLVPRPPELERARVHLAGRVEVSRGEDRDRDRALA